MADESGPALPAKTAERTGWLATVDTRGGNLPEAWDPTGLASAYQVATLLSRSALVPEALRGKAEDVMLVLWMGKEMGLSTMTALRHLPVVKGKVAISAELMRARAQSHPEAEYLEVVEASAEVAVVESKRKGRPAVRSSFTLAEAKAAGLYRPDSGWSKYTQDMLVARATSRHVRRHFPEVLGPVSYTAEEVSDFDEPRQGAAGRAAQAIVARHRSTVVACGGPFSAPATAPTFVQGEESSTHGTIVVPSYDDLGSGPGRPLPADGLRGDAPIPRERLVPPVSPPPDDIRAEVKKPKPWQAVLDLQIPGVGDKIAEGLLAGGLDTAEKIVALGLERALLNLQRVPGVGKGTAKAILEWAIQAEAMRPMPGSLSAPPASQLVDEAPAAATSREGVSQTIREIEAKQLIRRAEGDEPADTDSLQKLREQGLCR